MSLIVFLCYSFNVQKYDFPSFVSGISNLCPLSFFVSLTRWKLMNFIDLFKKLLDSLIFSIESCFQFHGFLEEQIRPKVSRRKEIIRSEQKSMK